jgi:hypothetical protein
MPCLLKAVYATDGPGFDFDDYDCFGLTYAVMPRNSHEAEWYMHADPEWNSFLQDGAPDCSSFLADYSALHQNPAKGEYMVSHDVLITMVSRTPWIECLPQALALVGGFEISCTALVMFVYMSIQKRSLFWFQDVKTLQEISKVATEGMTDLEMQAMRTE